MNFIFIKVTKKYKKYIKFQIIKENILRINKKNKKIAKKNNIYFPKKK